MKGKICYLECGKTYLGVNKNEMNLRSGEIIWVVIESYVNLIVV